MDSDASQASIFGLRSIRHEVEQDECDELSDVSNDEEDKRAMAERGKLTRWRKDNFLEDDLDFAYVFANFEEAYSNAGRAVGVAWSRARLRAEPEMTTDTAKISAVEATAAKIRKVDGQRKTRAEKKKK